MNHLHDYTFASTDPVYRSVQLCELSVNNFHIIYYSHLHLDELYHDDTKLFFRYVVYMVEHFHPMVLKYVYYTIYKYHDLTSLIYITEQLPLSTLNQHITTDELYDITFRHHPTIEFLEYLHQILKYPIHYDVYKRSVYHNCEPTIQNYCWTHRDFSILTHLMHRSRIH